MTLSSLLAPKTAAAAALPWKAAAVSAAPRRTFVALARAGPLVVPAVGARTPAKPPRLPAAPLAFFFFSSGPPSPAARKPGGAAAAAKKASPKPRKSKAGAAKAKNPAARKSTAAKGRLGAKKGSAAKAKPGRAGAQARAKSAAAKAKARAVAKAKARTVAKAKARAVANAKKVKAREAKARAKARATAKARQVLGKKLIRAKARSMLELKRAIPRRVSNPLSLFYVENVPKNLPLVQGVKIARDSWNTSSESTKQAYKEKAHANAENFGRVMERWIGSLTPEQKSLAKSTKFLETLPSYKARVIRRVVRKSSSNPYSAFVKAVCPEFRAAVKRDRPDLAGKQLQMATIKLMGEKWRGLSDDQKKVYARV